MSVTLFKIIEATCRASDGFRWVSLSNSWEVLYSLRPSGSTYVNGRTTSSMNDVVRS